MQQRKGGIIFALGVGLLVAVLSYRWLVDPHSHEERQRQEQVVLESRTLLQELIGSGMLEIVDPLSPDRKVGKVYVYPANTGWEVSGYYRRSDTDLWHPYLLSLDENLALLHLKISDQDPALIDRGTNDSRLEVMR
jgi:hypothetical protein